ncbi:MAG: zinc finger Ran-binding domain-containing protein [Candidatus Thorarchaeota archaeon]
MKNLHLWAILLIIDLSVGLVFWFLPSNLIWLSNNAVAPEILGTFIGIFGAISLERVLKLYSELKTETRLIEELITEIGILYDGLSRNLESDNPQKAIGTRWETAKAAGELLLLDTLDAAGFTMLYTLVDIYNYEVDFFNEFAIHHPEDTKGIAKEKEQLDEIGEESQNLMKAIANGIVSGRFNESEIIKRAERSLWNCRSCGAMNFRAFEKCIKCGRPSDEVTESESK